MADIFISYSQKDRDWVRKLGDALTAEGYEVWWDLDIRAGESIGKAIERMLPLAKCVVVVWSPAAKESDWVRAESAWAKERNKLVSIRIQDELELPIDFYHILTDNFSTWDGSSNAPEFRKLVTDIRKVASPPTLPAPAPITGLAAASAPLSTFRETLKDGSQGPEMVVIPAGQFQMGCLSGKDCSKDELPVHTVTFDKPFAIGKCAVTFDEYDRFAEATGGRKPVDKGWGRGRRPVINVTWDEVRKYANWLSERTGKHYRLPTEAEWEYAARAGTQTRWFFGDDEGALGKYAWYRDNSRSMMGSMIHPVGDKQANPWGLYDIHGNVLEWTEDCWHDNYEGAPKDGSAWRVENGGECGRRVVRGGAWGGRPRFLRSAYRGGSGAGSRYSALGFRLAQDL